MKKFMLVFAIIFTILVFGGGGFLLATNTIISAEDSISSQEEEVSARANGYWIDYGDSLSGYNFSRTGDIVYIYSINDMAAVLAGVNQNWYFSSDNVYLKNVNFVLKTDLDLSAHWWTPMFLSSGCYFDGNGHKISGVYVDVVNDEELGDATHPNYSNRVHAGFLATGTIKNVVLSTSWVRVKAYWTDKDRAFYVGAAVAQGIAENVINDNMDIFVYSEGWWPNINQFRAHDIFVGGIVGSGSAYDCAMNNSIGTNMGYSEYAEESCSIYVTGKGAVRCFVGGIVGDANEVLRCCSDAEIYVGSLRLTYQTGIGGIAGQAKDVQGCVVSDRAQIRSGGLDKKSSWLCGVGGIVGVNIYDAVNIENCFNYAKIESYSDGLCTGGILGGTQQARSSIYYSANFGSISSMTEANTGGIVGDAVGGCYVSNCGSYGGIYAPGDEANVGGIVGRSYSSCTVQFCVLYAYIYASNPYSYVGYVERGGTIYNNLDFCGQCTYNCLYNSNYTLSSSENYYYNGDFGSANSLKNNMNNHSYSTSTKYDTNCRWIAVKSGTCGFSGYYSSYWAGYYSYIVLPMKVFRPVTTQTFWRKPNEQTGVWETAGENNGFSTKSSSVMLFVNGVERPVSFTMTNNQVSTFVVSPSVWGGYMDSSTDPHLNNNGVTQKFVYEGGWTYTLAGWSFTSTLSGNTRSFTTDFFWSGNASTPLMIHFYLECKATNFTIENDSTKGTVVVTPKGSNRKNFTYAYRNGKSGYGPFYYNDTISSIVVTPKLGYKVDSIKWNGSSKEFSVDGENGCGVATTTYSSTIGIGLAATIIVTYTEVVYKVQIANTWDENNAVSGYNLYRSGDNAVKSFTGNLGTIYRMYYSLTAIPSTGSDGSPTSWAGADEEGKKELLQKWWKEGGSDIKNLDSGNTNGDFYRATTLKMNNGTISAHYQFTYDEIVGDEFKSIYTDTFYIYVTKDEVSFDLSIVNKANWYNDLLTFSEYENKNLFSYENSSATPIGGYLKIDAKTAIENEDTGVYWFGGLYSADLSDGKFTATTFYGWTNQKLSFANVSKVVDVDAVSTLAYDTAKDFWQQYLAFKYFNNNSETKIENVYYNSDLDNVQGNEGLQFYFYAYHQLDSYLFKGVVEVDGVEINSLNGEVITFTTEEKNSNDVENGRLLTFNIENRIHFMAPAKIESVSEYLDEDVAKNPYIFAGWYLRTVDENQRNKDVLLSTARTYNFANDNLLKANSFANGNRLGLGSEESAKLENLKIVAKFNRVTSNSTTLNAVRDVYEIRNKDELIALSKAVANGNSFAGCIVNQTADIDLNGVSFNPVGSEKTPFKGVYNGNNHIIKNLKVAGNSDANTRNRGLFGYVDGATIKNLTIYSGTVYGRENVGAAVGYAHNSRFEFVSNYNCIVNDVSVVFHDIYGLTLSGASDVYGNIYLARSAYAGLVGKAVDCSFFACSNRASVGFENSAEAYVGGLVGVAEVDVKVVEFDQCYNQGEVYGEQTSSNSLSNGGVLKNCYGRAALNGSSVAVYYNTVGNVMARVPSVDDVWFIVSGKPTLRVFYWN